MEEPNSDYIDQLSGDNVEFRNKLIKILKRELPEEAQDYYNFIQEKNYASAAASVHKLKHKVSILGLNKSYYIAERFEDNLKESSLELQQDFDVIIEMMQEYVKNL
jgi:hypothetical protein